MNTRRSKQVRSRRQRLASLALRSFIHIAQVIIWIASIIDKLLRLINTIIDHISWLIDKIFGN